LLKYTDEETAFTKVSSPISNSEFEAFIVAVSSCILIALLLENVTLSKTNLSVESILKRGPLGEKLLKNLVPFLSSIELEPEAYAIALIFPKQF
jgi:hypothetical protein